MNCDECKEQILELIEREAIDPEGVREVLERCPDCRADFEATKALLAVAAELPVEAPPGHLDEAILGAARTRGNVKELRPSAAWRQPLAMAAAALLIVGIGVSTLSIIGDSSEGRLAEAPLVQDEAAEAESARDLGADADEPIVLAEATADLAAGNVAEVAPQTPPAAARAKRARAPRKKEGAMKSAPAPQPADAELEAERDDLRAARSGDAPSAQAAGAFATAEQKSVAVEEAADTDVDLKRECERKARELEKHRKGDGSDMSPPEAQLEVGLCYQRLGDRDEARRWLERAAEHPSTRARANEALKELE